MIRTAFTLKLKPGGFAEYKKHHDEIWPELVAELRRCGINSITSFERDSTIFLFSEVESADSWQRLWDSDVHKRWAEIMTPLMEMTEDGKPASWDLTEIFRVNPPNGKH